jgi:flagellar protein FliO/FliZ
MPGWIENILASKSVTLLAATIVFLVIAALISLVFRSAFRRLRLPRNGRARQPRLGIIDAFDLDRQRQLVIVRRDNVEHLLMIGGPNDLVIESEIIRAESRDPRGLRQMRLRDKELREREPRESPPVPVGESYSTPPAEMAANPHQRKALPLAPAEAERSADFLDDSARVPAPSLVSPRTPVFPLPPRWGPPPANAPGQRLQSEPNAFRTRVEPPQKREAATKPPTRFSRASVATPFLRSSVQRHAPGEATESAPAGAPETPPVGRLAFGSPDSNMPAPPPGDEEAAAAQALTLGTAPQAVPGDTAHAAHGAGEQDTLEEEMARLLGR